MTSVVGLKFDLKFEHNDLKDVKKLARPVPGIRSAVKSNVETVRKRMIPPFRQIFLHFPFVTNFTVF